MSKAAAVVQIRTGCCRCRAAETTGGGSGGGGAVISPCRPQLHLPWMIFSMGCGGSRADAIIEPRYHESWTRETESTWLTNTDVETPLPVAAGENLPVFVGEYSTILSVTSVVGENVPDGVQV